MLKDKFKSSPIDAREVMDEIISNQILDYLFLSEITKARLLNEDDYLEPKNILCFYLKKR